MEKIDGYKEITSENSSRILDDITWNLNGSLWTWDEEIRCFFNKFSDLYYISCDRKDIDQWRSYNEIYEILKRFADKADNHPLEVLIWKYSEESMKNMVGKNGRSTKPFQYLVWFSGWTMGRASKDIINKIREIIPDKITELRCK